MGGCGGGSGSWGALSSFTHAKPHLEFCYSVAAPNYKYMFGQHRGNLPHLRIITVKQIL